MMFSWVTSNPYLQMFCKNIEFVSEQTGKNRRENNILANNCELTVYRNMKRNPVLLKCMKYMTTNFEFSKKRIRWVFDGNLGILFITFHYLRNRSALAVNC